MLLVQKRYLKILLSWSSSSLPGNNGLPALASSEKYHKGKTKN
jgi:hypothetical protein